MRIGGMHHLPETHDFCPSFLSVQNIAINGKYML
jgi:hypothetical protein